MSKSSELAHILTEHRRWLESDQSAGQRADLSGAQLDGVDLSGADLRGALLTGASLNAANLTDAQLVHADLSEASLHGANLRGANVVLTNFTRADLSDADLSDTRADDEARGQMNRGPRFREANLEGAVLVRAYCSSSDFRGARLKDTNLSRAVLNNADLSGLDLGAINLCAAHLERVNLADSELTAADLRDAGLRHARLFQANLTDADVSGADLRSADLHNTKVDGVRYSRKTRFRGCRVNSCYGSARFKRFAQDQDFIEEFREAHPLPFFAWWVLSDCGRSLLLVVAWCVLLAVLFGLLFYSLGEASFAISHKETMHWSLFTTIYYSVVTFTTLGFGDITPRTPTAAVAVMVEVVVGYLMLGILISILANKVARRS